MEGAPPPHTLSVTEVLRNFDTDQHVGLSDEQVAAGQAKYGPNGQSDCGFSSM